MRARPTTVPIATRIAGVMRLFSKEYFTRNTIPRKRTNPPIQAKSFTPKNASQSNGLAGGGGIGGGAGGGRTCETGGGGGGGRSGLGGTGGGMGNTTSLIEGGGANVTGSGEEIGSGAAAFAELERDSKSATRWTRFRSAALSLRSWTTPMIKKINGAR